jgi:hypothetical protein
MNSTVILFLKYNETIFESIFIKLIFFQTASSICKLVTAEIKFFLKKIEIKLYLVIKRF